MVTAVHLSIMSLSLLHPTTPGRAQVGINEDLQELLDRFPNPGDDFLCCKSPTFCIGITKIMKILVQMPPTLETNHADNLLQMPTHSPTWDKWGLTMIGALQG